MDVGYGRVMKRLLFIRLHISGDIHLTLRTNLGEKEKGQAGEHYHGEQNQLYKYIGVCDGIGFTVPIITPYRYILPLCTPTTLCFEVRMYTYFLVAEGLRNPVVRVKLI